MPKAGIAQLNRYKPIAMRNFYFVVIFAAFFFENLYGQNPLPQEIRRIHGDAPSESAPSHFIATSDCGFVVAGTLGQKGFLWKLDAGGEHLWRKGYLFGTKTAFNALAELPSGELVAVGSCNNCAPGDTAQKALVLKADAFGTALQDTTLGLLNYSASATAVITTAEGKAAIAGWFDWIVGFVPLSHAFLTVLDGRLAPGFWGEYDESSYDVPQALAQTADGGYLIAGHSRLHILFGPDRAQLFRTNSQGQLLWKSVSVHAGSSFNGVQEAPDGRIIALGWRQVDTVSRKDVYLAVHSPLDGQLLLDSLYGSPAEDTGYGLHRVEGGYLVAANWRQPRQDDWGFQDWVFRLDEDFNIVEEYFNDTYLANHRVLNAIPLSSDGRDFAYLSRIHSVSGLSYDLFYKRSAQGRHALLSKTLQHYQLLPRNLATNKGVAVYEGSLETPGVYDEMRLKVFRNNVLIQALYDATPQGFSFHVEIEAELANYSFKLVGVKNGKEFPEAEAQGIVAGDAYIIQGQSNALAGIPFDLTNTVPHAYRYHRNPFVRNFGLKPFSDSLVYAWRREADDDAYFSDNRSGQWGLVLGEKIVEEQGVPVAIINGGIGGISIDNMLPDPEAPHSSSHSYGRFYQRVEASGLHGNIRAIFFFQGETNALPGYNETVDSYKDKYLRLRSAWQSDFTYEREYLFQIRPGCWEGNFSVIQEAQRQLALELPNVDIMSATGMNHDGCHYHYLNGYQRAGEDMYRLLAYDFYDAPEMPDIYPPAVDSAWFSSCDRREITLRLQPGDDYFWTPGWETDFRPEGDTQITMESGQVVGNTVILSLSASPGAGFTGLSYIGHSGGSEAPVKNGNGIGMLCFYNFPAAPPEPLIETFSQFICPGEQFVLPDGMAVDEPGFYISTFTSVEGCDSLIVTEISFFDPPSVSGLDIEAASCIGSADGAATAHPEGGAPPYDYFWSDGQTTATATGLAAGNYTVSVTDANGCETVVEAEIPALDYEPALAIGQADNTLTVAEENASYQWINCDSNEEIINATGRSYNVEESGSYAVVVSEAKCRDTSECVTVTIVNTEDVSAELQLATVFPNPSNGQFTLVLPWKAELHLYGASGCRLLQEPYGAGVNELGLSELPAGVYTLSLRRAEGVQVLRIVKQ